MSNNYYPYDDDDENDGIISKSQNKRDMQGLRDLCKQIADMPKQQRTKMPVSEQMAIAIEHYLKVPTMEARRRQMQYMGKLMRNEDLEGIQQAIALLDAGSDANKQIMFVLERWRERLLNGGNEVIAEFYDKYPACELQQLRQLVRGAKKEQEEELKHPGTLARKQGKTDTRKLFLFVKKAMADAADDADEDADVADDNDE
ncbi:MAG: DUF615 domain-containing protein [Oceanospirillaceae bacterium]|nr:DUF615 domain-containing protein [Oceanospirillaceae bacterium]